MTDLVDFAVYETATGKIKRLMKASEAMMNIQAGAGESIAQGLADFETDYILNDAITPRPVNNSVENKSTVTADGSDYVRVSNIPIGTIVTVPGLVDTGIQVDDGQLDITFDEPNSYVIVINSFPELKKEISIDAT